MDVLVPFDASAPKTRLSTVLDIEERREFAAVMLEDVLEAIGAAGGRPTVLATAEIDTSRPAVVDERSLDAAVNARLGADGPTAVVMGDLALATPDALRRLFEADGDIVLVPGRGGGTNAFVARDADFRVDYHDASITDHRAIAREIGADCREIDSFRLATDIDEPADLLEVLLHTEGRAASWLRGHGFEPAIESGRAGVRR